MSQRLKNIKIESSVANTNNIQNETWFKSFWRPGMGWLYMAICACDFILFPIASMVIPGVMGFTYIPWKSITLENGGLIHLAFGAILGVTAYTRSIEKMRNSQNEQQ